MQLKTLEYKADDSVTLVVLGAIHGNEKCGTRAINKIAEDIDNGSLNIVKGRLLMVPICNKQAYDENVRFIDRNLNRQLYPEHQGSGYEDAINSELCGILQQGDVLLDLHSYASKGGAFIFLGQDNIKEQEFATSLGVNNFVYGWQDAFGNANAQVDQYESMGTTEYMRHVGGMGITLECGHHHNKDADKIGYNAIINALIYLGMIEAEKITFDKRNEQICAHMELAFYKKREGELEKQWQHYNIVSKGETLATYDDGKTIIAPEDGYIILPKLNAKIGKEWFFFATKSQLPCS